MNSKWFYITIVPYSIIPPYFDSRYRERNWTTTLSNLPPENRELYMTSELHKIKNPFSLFRQRAANCPIERTLWIDAYRINYVYSEIESNIAYLWGKKIIMILEQIRFLSGKRLQNHDVAATLTPGRKSNVENTTLQQR